MHSQVSAPTQFKGRISEMLSQLRMRNHIDTQNQERYAMDPIAQDDIKAVRKENVYEKVIEEYIRNRCFFFFIST